MNFISWGKCFKLNINFYGFLDFNNICEKCLLVFNIILWYKEKVKCF